MSDEQYAQWKNQKGLSKSLYDRYIDLENKLLANDNKNKASLISKEDSVYFYYENEYLTSKNGIFLDKVLNNIGLIQVGNYLIRYQNGNIYYAESNSHNANLLLDKNTTINELNTVSNYRGLNKTVSRSVSDHTIPLPTASTTFNYKLLDVQHRPHPARKYWVRLFENYVLVPTGGSYWNILYRCYFEFGQHKRVLFTWNTYPASTKGNLHFYGSALFQFNGPITFTAVGYFPGEFLEARYHLDHATGIGTSPGLIPSPQYIESVNSTHPTFTLYSGSLTNVGELHPPLTTLYTIRTNLKLNSWIFDIPDVDTYYNSY